MKGRIIKMCIIGGLSIGFLIAGTQKDGRVNEKLLVKLLKKYENSNNKEKFLRDIEKELKYHPTPTIKALYEIIKDKKKIENVEKGKIKEKSLPKLEKSLKVK